MCPALEEVVVVARVAEEEEEVWVQYQQKALRNRIGIESPDPGDMYHSFETMM